MFFFFFQAEDGIRDYKVTGVQTCALPISRSRCSTWRMMASRRASAWLCCTGAAALAWVAATAAAPPAVATAAAARAGLPRSEERRVGEEGRSPWAPYHLKKKTSDRIVIRV